jgi:hypothetical protein
VVTATTHTMNEVVAIMTGATEPGAVGYDQVAKEQKREPAGHGHLAVSRRGGHPTSRIAGMNP